MWPCVITSLDKVLELTLPTLKVGSACRRSNIFTQPPMRICFTDVFFVFLLFSFFSVRYKNTRQPFSGTAERIFVTLLPNDSGENGVCIAVPKWGLGLPINFLGAKNYTLRTWW